MPRPWRRPEALLAGASLVVCAVVLAARLPPLLHAYESAPATGRLNDFPSYLDAAKRARQGLPLYDLAAARTLDGFLYPPPAILFFLPFTALSAARGDAVLVVLSLAALFAALAAWQARAAPDAPPLRRYATWALALVLGPTWMTFDYAQVNLLALAATVACLWLAERRRPGWAGAALSCGIALKLYPAVLLVLAVRDARYRRVALACGAALGGWVLASRAALGSFEAYRTYVVELLPTVSRNLPVDVCNQSVAAVVGRIGRSPEELVAYWPVVPASPATNALVAAGAVAALVTLVRWGGEARSPRRPLVEAAILALVPVVSPLGWGHAFVFALPLAVGALQDLHRAPAGWKLAVLAAVAALLVQSDERFDLLARAPLALQALVYARYPLATALLFAAGAAHGPWRGPIASPR
jgi:alpha-1,2-mannosyltransferase